jgi:hypothetical protein
MSAKRAAATRKVSKRIAKKKARPSSKKAPPKKAAKQASTSKTKAPAPKITKKKTAAKKKSAAKTKTAAKKKTAIVKKPAVEKKTQKPASPVVALPKLAKEPKAKPPNVVKQPKAKEPKVAKEPIAAPPAKKEEPVSETLNAPAKKPGVLRVARGERRPTRSNKKQDPVETARAALAKVGMPEKDNGEVKKPGRVVEINPRLESSRDKIESKPTTQQKPPSVAEKKRQEAEAAFQKIAPQHNELTQHFHKSRFDVRISERDSLATQIRMSASHEEALKAARELADRYKLPPDQVTLLRIVELGDERLTKLALEELLELDDKGRVRPTSDLITTVTAIHSKDAETIELKDLLLEKVRPR